MSAPATFWPQTNPGVRYVRATLPARALGAKLLDFDTELERHRQDFDLLESQEGVGVWQLIANRIRWWRMEESRSRFGAAFLEIDDDYTEWQPRYARGGWADDYPDEEDVSTSSVALHRHAARFADGVIVSTPQLAERYSAYNENVHVCQNAVDPEDWSPLPERDDGIFRIVFAGAPDSGDLAMIRRGMEWAAAQPGVEATVFGFNPKWRGVKTVPWVNDIEAYREKLVELKPDLGLRPVENTVFSKGKSDLKILEYAMAGAAALVSSHEAYLGWREQPVRFAYSAKDWEQEIKRAVKHRDAVREDAAALRATVLASRTAEQVAPQWRAALASVVAV